MFQRIMVIGCPGAGKSTFSRALRDRLGLPLYYLDCLWHREDKTTVSREEFDKALSELLEGERWIIDGNYNRTLEARLKRCDTVFLLDYPPETCLAGVRERIGKKREDLPWLEEELDEEFYQWVVDFPRTQLPRIYELLERYRAEKNVIVFRSRQEAEEFLKRGSIMNIRLAKSRDVELLHKYDYHIAREELENAVALGRVYLAEQDGRLVGWLRYNLFWDYIPFMNLLYIQEEERGKGIGRQLVEQWESDMAHKGCSMLLTSTQSNEYAQHFYVHLGYEAVGGFRLEGEPYEMIFAKKR